MRRAELEHIIRAASQVVGDDELIIVGSQAILGQLPDAPKEMLVSREADIFPRNEPERADEIDEAMGDGSYFDATFGYYAHGVGPETAKAPAGWEERLIALRNANTNGATGWCLEIHDLVLAKCAAGRERDWEFAEQAVSNGLVEVAVLRRRAPEIPISDSRKEDLIGMLEALIERHS